MSWFRSSFIVARNTRSTKMPGVTTRSGSRSQADDLVDFGDHQLAAVAQIGLKLRLPRGTRVPCGIGGGSADERHVGAERALEENGPAVDLACFLAARISVPTPVGV